MARVRICSVGDVPMNALKQFDDPARGKVCVVNAGDRFFACQAECPHEGVALSDGVFDGDVLTCLEHLWQWSLRSGGEPRGLAEEPLQIFSVEVEDGAIYLDTDS